MKAVVAAASDNGMMIMVRRLRRADINLCALSYRRNNALQSIDDWCVCTAC